MAKNIILSYGQYQRLMESISTDDVPVINGTSDSELDIPQKGQELAEKVKQSGAQTAKIKITPKTATSDNNVEISGQGNTVYDQFKDAVDSAVRSGMDKRNTTFSVTVGNDGKPIQNEFVLTSKHKLLEETKKTNNFSDVLETFNKTFNFITDNLEETINDYKNSQKEFMNEIQYGLNEISETLNKLNIQYNVSYDVDSDKFYEIFDTNDGEFEINIYLNNVPDDENIKETIEDLTKHNDIYWVDVDIFDEMKITISGYLPIVKTTTN